MPAGGDKQEGFVPNRIIHEPARLRIVSYLAASSTDNSFTELRERLGLTAGNLSVQLRKLEEAGYVAVDKSFRGRRPLTRVALTPQGLDALRRYLAGLEEMIERLKGTTASPAGKHTASPLEQGKEERR